MKKTLTFSKWLIYYLMIIGVAIVSSCSDDSTKDDAGPAGTYDLSVSVETLTFDASSDLSKQIVLTAGDTWSLLNDSDDSLYAYADWVSDVSPDSGSRGEKSVTITVEENLTSTSRYTSLYFGIKKSDESYELVELKVGQDGCESGAFIIDRDDVWFSSYFDDASNYTCTLNITSDYSWKVLNNGGDEAYDTYDWITFNTTEGTGSGELTFTVSPYVEETDLDRSANIYIQYNTPDAQIKYMKISQFSKNTSHLSSQQSYLGTFTVDQAGTPIEFRIISSNAWAIPDNDPYGLTGALEWVSLSPMSGVCNDVAVLDCEPNNTGNTRTSNIYTMMPSASGDWRYHSFTVEQAGIEGLEFSLSYDSAYGDSSANSISIPADGSGIVTQVKSSNDWRIDSSSPHYTDGNGWLKTSITEGSNGYLITFSSNSENSSFDSRKTTVHFYMDAFPEMDPVVYTVTQEGKSYNSAEMTLSCSLASSTSDSGDITIAPDAESTSSMSYTISVSAELPWEIVETPASWVKTSVTENTAGVKTLYVTVKNNGFSSGRKTTIALQQKYGDAYYGAEKSVAITQSAKDGAILSTYRDLGYGYDISGLYAHSKYIKKQVLDWDKMNALDIIDDVTYYGSDMTYSKSTNTSISSIQDSLCISAGVAVKYNGFSTAVNAGYASDYQSYEESEYGEETAIVNLANLSTTCDITSDSGKSALRSCLTDTAYVAINSIKSVDEAKTFIGVYGAYVMMGCTYGGTYKYSVSAVRKKSDESVTWSTMVSAGYEDATGANSISADVGAGAKYTVEDESYVCDERITICGGGESIKDIDLWYSSLAGVSADPVTNMALIDYGGVPMVAISELAEDSNARSYLELAIDELTQNSAVETVTATQSIFSYEFWIGEILYYGGESGDDYAEVLLSVSSKMVNSESEYWRSIGNINWVTMWDNSSNEIKVPVDGGGVTVLQMGTGTTTQTNRFSTGNIFTGGTGSHIFGFKIFAEENDVIGTDDASTTYAFFQTKTGYLGSCIAEKPFYYLYSVDDQSTPQDVIQEFSNYHTLSWTSVAENVGNGDWRNGYALVEGVQDDGGEHKWRFTIYYRML